MYTQSLTPSTGEAYIAVKKNRVKHYPSSLAGVQNATYLSDKQEFEIELYNPSTFTKLAKISINGKPISASGIVLKPGQRSFIERYIDTARKFLFETYEVENTTSGLAAIQNNGLIEISFYDEYVPPQYTPTYDWGHNRGIGGQSVNSGQNINYLNQQNSSLRRSRLDTMDFMGQSAMFCSSSAPESATLNLSGGLQREIPTVKETGTVEQGAVSQQKFTNYVGKFNTWITNTVTLKLLPYSEKPVEIGEVVCYCTECGTKNKGNKFKFCPTCGNKF